MKELMFFSTRCADVIIFLDWLFMEHLQNLAQNVIFLSSFRARPRFDFNELMKMAVGFPRRVICRKKFHKLSRVSFSLPSSA